MAELDPDQEAALRRLRAVFGPIEVVEVVNNDPGDDLAVAQDETIEGARVADPRRMTLRSTARPTRCWSRRSPIRTGKPPARPWTT
jgi:hypothetical protein